MTTQTKVGIAISNLSGIIFILAFILAATPLFVMGGLMMLGGGVIGLAGMPRQVEYSKDRRKGVSQASEQLEIEAPKYYDHITDEIVDKLPYEWAQLESESFQQRLIDHANRPIEIINPVDIKTIEPAKEVFEKEDVFTDAVSVKEKVEPLVNNVKDFVETPPKKQEIEYQTFAENVVVETFGGEDYIEIFTEDERIEVEPDIQVRKMPELLVNDMEHYGHQNPVLRDIAEKLPLLRPGFYWNFTVTVHDEDVLWYSEEQMKDRHHAYKMDMHRYQYDSWGYVEYPDDALLENPVRFPAGMTTLTISYLDDKYNVLEEIKDIALSMFKYNEEYISYEEAFVHERIDIRQRAEKESEDLIASLVRKCEHLVWKNKKKVKAAEQNILIGRKEAYEERVPDYRAAFLDMRGNMNRPMKTVRYAAKNERKDSWD